MQRYDVFPIMPNMPVDLILIRCWKFFIVVQLSSELMTLDGRNGEWNYQKEHRPQE
jgi:hypothetical protein